MKIINSNTEDAHKGWGYIETKQCQGTSSALREATDSKGVMIIHSSRVCQVHWRQFTSVKTDVFI